MRSRPSRSCMSTRKILAMNQTNRASPALYERRPRIATKGFRYKRYLRGLAIDQMLLVIIKRHDNVEARQRFSRRLQVPALRVHEDTIMIKKQMADHDMNKVYQVSI